ncbi:MAG: hypothetical protein ACKVU4_03935 [Phycisphaerales bacterium]
MNGSSRRATFRIVVGLSLLVTIGGGGAEAQVGPQVRVDTLNPNSGVETAIAVSRINSLEVVAAAIDWRLGINEGPRIGYAITRNGGASFATEDYIRLPVGHPLAAVKWEVDPFAAADPVTGDIWVGGVVIQGATSPSGVFVARKALGAGVLGSTILVTSHAAGGFQDDKPLMAVGRRPGSPSQTTQYVVFSRKLDPTLVPGAPGPCTSVHLVLARSRDAGQTWDIRNVAPTPHPGLSTTFHCQYNGLGAAPVVLSSGRLVVVWRDALANSPYDGDYLAAYSDDEGDTWNAPPSSPPSSLPWNLFPDPPVRKALVTDIAGKFRLPSLPGIAVDPVNDDVYVVVSARKSVVSTNLDVWVTRSTDGGVTFAAPERLPLDDTDFEDAPDQIMPWIAIDRADGVAAMNILYYDTRHHVVSDASDVAYLDAYHARIKGWGSGNWQIVNTRLTPTTFDTSVQYEAYLLDPFANADLDQFIGDYQMIDAAGCHIYPNYMSLQTATRHYYLHHVTSSCDADMDGNSAVNGADASLFQNILFPSGDPLADADHTGSVTAADVTAFLSAYAGGGP